MAGAGRKTEWTMVKGIRLGVVGLAAAAFVLVGGAPAIAAPSATAQVSAPATTAQASTTTEATVVSVNGNTLVADTAHGAVRVDYSTALVRGSVRTGSRINLAGIMISGVFRAVLVAVL
jgi:uncharacterized lipoprotein YajG